MKARIYQNQEDGHGIILPGEIIEFYLGTEGWNLTVKGLGVVEKYPDLFEVIDLNGKRLKGNPGAQPESKADIYGETVQLGFTLGSGFRVQIFKEEEA